PPPPPPAAAPTKGSAVALRRFVPADVVATRVDHESEPAVQDPRATVATDDVVPEDQRPLATVLAPGKHDPRALRRRSLRGVAEDGVAADLERRRDNGRAVVRLELEHDSGPGIVLN